MKKIKNYWLKIIILFIICIYIFPTAVSAEEQRVVFNHLDGKGDDYGPGYYSYPQNHIFQNKGHLFDLKAITIFELENEYKFRFSFSNLTDPWGAEYDFSLPLLELYIDNQAGGSNQLFEKGANATFKKDFYWNKFFKISGWWVRQFNPNSKSENSLNINDLSLSTPASKKNIKLSRVDNDIYLSLPKNEINSLQNSKLVVLVGSFDPFGYDHFRSLSKTKDYWQIYSEKDINISKSTRVLDILVPRGSSQKEILEGELPELPYLKVNIDLPPHKPTIVDRLKPINKVSLSILFLYIFILIFTIYKFDYRR